ncbi:unnamed protein product [Caenorhabditis sp. 36 PRJEB53466]|nr:unnamed protein product [Caenorhabditis sp. 36 PRJEB53466]
MHKINKIQEYNLLEISEVEQANVSEGDHNKCIDRVRELMKKHGTRFLTVLQWTCLIRLKSLHSGILELYLKNFPDCMKYEHPQEFLTAMEN